LAQAAKKPMTPAQPAVWGPRELDYAVHDLAVQWSAQSSQLLIACSSFIPEASNFVEVLSVGIEGRTEVQAARRLPHYYPPTRVRWLGSDLLATSGDCLRIWSASGELQRLLRHEANPQARCTPITSVDASIESPSSTVTAGVQMVSADVYGVCNLWDMETGTMQQAIDLGQPLSDVAFGPNRLLAAAGENGDCFLMDTRQSKDVAVYAPAERVRGPARIAWGVHRPDMFAVSWQGEGGLVLYSGSHRTKAMPRVVKSSSSSTISSLQWSYAYPQLLACAREDGDVEVWHFPDEGVNLAATAEPSSHWAPRGRAASCTALAMTPEVRPGSHALVLSTMAAGATEVGAAPGALWIVALPQPHLGPSR